MDLNARALLKERYRIWELAEKSKQACERYRKNPWYIKRGYPAALNAEQTSQIISLYQKGILPARLALQFNVSHSTIVKYLGDTFQSRKHSLDLSVLNSPLSEEAFYWLGFIAGDGSIDPRGMMDLRLAVKDLEHLKLCAQFFKYDGPIWQDKGLPHPIWRLKIASTELRDRLIDFGITPNKTFTVTPSEKLANNRHFFRGFADADGTLGWSAQWNKDTLRFFFSFTKGSRAIILQARDHLKNILKFRGHVRKTSRAWRLEFWDRYAKQTVRYLYSDCSIALKRKLAIANEVIKN